jgi:ubiquinone/menaquinone biosynthesis C-methylase UbiE
VFAWGDSPRAALKAAIMTEDVAKTVHLAMQIGPPSAIPPAEAEKCRRVCRERGFDVRIGDQSFLEFPDGHFDLVWSRHCLEHSPMPLMTLFEYNRVVRDAGFVYVEVPQADSIHIEKPNHYSLFSDRGWRNLFKRAKFEIAGHTIYTLSYRWPRGVVMDDYYYGYWLKKTEPIR